MRAYGMLIDGEFTTGAAKPVINPATGLEHCLAPSATVSDVDRAIRAANRACRGWRDLGFERRAEIVQKVAYEMYDNQELLTDVLVYETGKPRRMAVEEVLSTARMVDSLTKIRIDQQVLQDSLLERKTLRHEPLGIVAVIAPWNAPLKLSMQPAAAALYTGNAVIIKPSPYAPLATLMMGEIMRDAGVPAGVVNVLNGGASIGQYIVAHEGVNKVSFTGSIDTGKQIYGCASGTLKRVTLELGGNDAAIVLDDARVADIAQSIFASAFAHAGQVCMAIKRLYVHRSRYAEMVDALTECVEATVIGSGFDPSVTMGPVQNLRQFGNVLDIIADAIHRGAEVKKHSTIPTGYTSGGYFIPPSLVLNPPDVSRVVSEEQFGPVLPIIPYENVGAAVGFANDTKFGLCGSVWGTDIARATAISEKLEVGTALVNQHRISTNALVPFGGVKQSGIGHNYSESGLKENMEARVTCVRKS